MWGHLSDETLLDVLEGTADEPARRHASECAACSARVADARQGLARAEDAEVPEPSPLFWETFRRQVGRRIESERAPRSSRVRFVPALVALAATVIVAIGLNLRGREAPPTTLPAQTIPAWTPLASGGDDVGLSAIEGLAPAAGDVSTLVSCPVEDCLAGLSDDESRAVAESLKQELSGRAL